MKFRFIPITLFIATLGIVFHAEASVASVVFIVNTKNPVKELNRKFLADAFLKKITFWENGNSILPVDLKSGSETRKEFSDEIMSRPVTAIRSYWQQMIFSGQTIPPVEFDTEEQVVGYVGIHLNALAYVSNKVALSSKVKVIVLK